MVGGGMGCPIKCTGRHNRFDAKQHNDSPHIYIPNIIAHGYDTFSLKVFLDNKWHQIPVENFNTMEGADCTVQDFDFYTNPFRIVRKKRDFGNSEMAVQPITLTLYELTPTGELVQTKELSLALVCDVKRIDTADLFHH